ncbi:MAG: hypothetical protein LUG86_02995, partial [Oscillospiraceae bacterium]|nr:hypothetical protein [Oscillospiraceae bacterium]
VVYCSVCGEELSRETITVPATGHDYVSVVTAPTCTEKGYTTYTCSVCNDSYTDNETDALGHTWDAGTVSIKATCTADGEMTYTCTVCGETRTETIPATGHTNSAAVIENEKAATCTTDGSYDPVVYCSVCGEEISRETITVPATGHSYTEAFSWSSDFTTCTVTFTCSECADVVEYTSTANEVTITEENGTYTATVTHDGTSYTKSVKTYTVTWIDGDGNVQVDSKLLSVSDSVFAGTPTKSSTEKYSYTFAGWEESVDTYGNVTYTATFTSTAHNYTATFNWASDLKSATVTLTCADCGNSITMDSSKVAITSVNRLGVVTRTATVTDPTGETHTDVVTTGTSLLRVQADYSAVNLAIARANGLNASDYVDFSGVTAAINAVQWNLNVLNQTKVNAYAEAIHTAIDSLVKLSDVTTEEVVEIDEPVEETETETEEDPEDLEVADDEAETETNPTTGIMISLIAITTATAAAIASKRR